MVFIITNMTSFVNKKSFLQYLQAPTMMKTAGIFNCFTFNNMSFYIQIIQNAN